VTLKSPSRPTPRADSPGGKERVRCRLRRALRGRDRRAGLAAGAWGRGGFWGGWLLARATLASIAGAALACSSLPSAPPPEVAARARAASSYSGTLRVSLNGPAFRGRARVLVGFRRPDMLRIELPGPTGPRLIVVAKDGALAAIFPGERAFFRSGATDVEMDALLGIALAPSELADVLVGVGSPRLRAYEVLWGPTLPRRVRATLPDGGRLDATVEEAELEAPLSPSAFDEPPHDGFRSVDQEEARRLWAK
jgi:hypothetical protein